MTPKEKAEEFLGKYEENDIELNDSIDGDYYGRMKPEDAKRCALIAVDEIINLLVIYNINPAITYWYKVKQEIEKL